LYGEAKKHAMPLISAKLGSWHLKSPTYSFSGSNLGEDTTDKRVSK
jgi:hypothetical protein